MQNIIQIAKVFVRSFLKKEFIVNMFDIKVI